jgi:hypothetical protein
MRILFDQRIPAPLSRVLTGHSIATAYEMGWAQLSNGALLRATEAQFDIFVTTDKNQRHQQALAGLRLAILVLPTTNGASIQRHKTKVVAAIDALRVGDVVELDFS